MERGNIIQRCSKKKEKDAVTTIKVGLSAFRRKYLCKILQIIQIIYCTISLH